MANIVIPFVAVALAQVPSVGFNNNFTEITSKFNTYAVQTDVAKTITVAHTFAADILFTDALYDIGKTGATRPRDIFLSRSLTAGGGIITGGTAQFGDAIVGNVGGNKDLLLQPGTAAGVIAFRSSTNVATVSISNSGAVSGVTTLAASGVITGAAVRLGTSPASSGFVNLPYQGAITWRNAANSGDIDVLYMATNVMLVSTIGFNVGGTLTLAPAISKIVPGATSVSFRNNADNADNFIMTDAGVATMRGQLVMTSTTQPIYLQNNAQIVWRNFANTADAFGIGTDITDNLRVGNSVNFAAVWLGNAGKKLSFYGGGGAGGVVQPTVAGAKGGNAALASLMAALGAAGLNLVNDTTT